MVSEPERTLERRVITERQFIDALMEMMDEAQTNYLEAYKILCRGTEPQEVTRTTYYAHVDKDGQVVELSFEKTPIKFGFVREQDDTDN